MHLIVEMEQRAVNGREGAPTRWAAYVRQGTERGSDLLKGRYFYDRGEAERAAKAELALTLEGYRYTLEVK